MPLGPDANNTVPGDESVDSLIGYKEEEFNFLLKRLLDLSRKNILVMGGMQACDFTLEKTPNEGLQQILALNKKDYLYNSMMLPLSLT